MLNISRNRTKTVICVFVINSYLHIIGTCLTELESYWYIRELDGEIRR
jgi:hypothetical protein